VRFRGFATAGIGLAGVAGAAMLALGGSPALASGFPGAGTPIAGLGTTNATVSIPAANSITDSTASITFTAPASLPGPATNNPQTVHLTVTSNDPDGWDASEAATEFSGIINPPDTFPCSALTIVSTSNPNGTSACASVADQGVAGTAAGGATFTDSYSLQAPLVAPDDYFSVINYTITPRS